MTGGSGGNSGRPGRRGCTVGVRVPGGRRSDNSENQTCQYERLNARNENKAHAKEGEGPAAGCC